MNRTGKRTFELRYEDPRGNAYFYVTLADYKQRQRVARKLGLKRGEMLLSVRHFWISQKLRGKGFGKQLIKRLTAALDALGLPTALYALPYDGNRMNTDGLVRFYEKAGFKLVGKVNQRGDEFYGCPLMVRGIV